jgi:DNA (cytosine-5)-methyltransferase 1
LNGLALCSGFGGIELGLESRIDGFRTVCHVEGEAYAASLIIKKIQEGTIHEAPVWSNVKTFNGKPWRSKVDIITGGFPCQPHSSAGKLLGEEDPRNLWPDVKRIISEVRPRLLFLENVSNINNTIAPTIVGDLAEMGFESAWCVVRASDVGAPHRRARWFIMAHAYGQSNNEELQRTNRKIPSKSKRLRRRKDKRKTGNKPRGKGSYDERQKQFEEWWTVEPPVGRMVDGVAHWVDRLRGCGNGVVPQQAAYAFDILSTALLNNDVQIITLDLPNNTQKLLSNYEKKEVV